MASAIMAIIAGTMLGLANGVQQSWQYTQQAGTETQHARVVLERINRLVSEALSTPSVTGVAVMYEDVGAWRFYDTLVIWHPSGAPQNPTGPPLVKECVVISPDPNDPTQLVEIIDPADNRDINVSNSAINQPTLRAVINEVKVSPTSQKTVLTDLLRAPEVDQANGRRGAFHAASTMQPTDTEISEYSAGNIAWNALSWPQDVFGSKTGLRRFWLRIELQLMPSRDEALNELGANKATGFFGSAAHGYRIDRGAY